MPEEISDFEKWDSSSRVIVLPHESCFSGAYIRAGKWRVSTLKCFSIVVPENHYVPVAKECFRVALKVYPEATRFLPEPDNVEASELMRKEAEK